MRNVKKGMMQKVLCIGIVGFLLLSGCYEWEVDGDKSKLTAEEAKQALIELLESLPGGHVLKPTLPGLKAEGIVMAQEGVIGVGRWECNLKNAEFAILLGNDWLLVHHAGIFKRGAKGKWDAVIEKTWRASGPDHYLPDDD